MTNNKFRVGPGVTGAIVFSIPMVLFGALGYKGERASQQEELKLGTLKEMVCLKRPTQGTYHVCYPELNKVTDKSTTLKLVRPTTEVRNLFGQTLYQTTLKL